MLHSRLLPITALICFVFSITIGCQARSSFESSRQGITINYPSSWVDLEESDEVITVRTSTGEATIGIKSFEGALSEEDLEAFLWEQMEWLSKEGSDLNKPIEYGNVRKIEHDEYFIFMGEISAFPRFSDGIEFRINSIVAVVQFQDKIVFVGSNGTGHVSLQNALDEIINGLEFH